MLINPSISVVGLSNWKLDAAKMNRAVYLHRPDPILTDVELTAECIVNDLDYSSDIPRTVATANTTNGLTKWLKPLAHAYHGIYTSQHGRELIGMRDFYGLLKLLRNKFVFDDEGKLSLLIYAITTSATTM